MGTGQEGQLRAPGVFSWSTEGLQLLLREYQDGFRESSSLRGCWGSEEVLQGMGTFPKAPELQECLDRVGLLWCLCRARSWNQ